jgi:hypothetical protein
MNDAILHGWVYGTLIGLALCSVGVAIYFVIDTRRMQRRIRALRGADTIATYLNKKAIPATRNGHLVFKHPPQCKNGHDFRRVEKRDYICLQCDTRVAREDAKRLTFCDLYGSSTSIRDLFEKCGSREKEGEE